MAAKVCEIRNNWREMTLSERLAAIRDLLTRLANDYEVPPPNVVRGPAPDNPLTKVDESTLPAAYDAASNTVFVTDTGDNFDKVLQNAGHEFAHEMFQEIFGVMYDKTSAAGMGGFLEDGESFAASEQDGYAADLEDACEDNFKESPGKSDSQPGDWNMPSESYA